MFISKMKEKLYSIWGIKIITLLFGPIAGVYLMSENFKALGKKKESDKTLWIGLVLSILLMGIFIFINANLPNYIFAPLSWLLYVFAISIPLEMYQKKKVNEILKDKSRKHSNWRLLGVSLLALLATLIINAITVLIFSLLSIVPPLF